MLRVGRRISGIAPHEVQSRRAQIIPKLLVIDDDTDTRRSLVLIASRGGWECLACDQFADVVATVRENAVDVMLTDYRMPPLTAFDLLEKLRAAGLHLPVLIISANAYSIDHRRASELGVRRILSKPPEIPELQRALADALSAGGPAA